MISKPVKKTFIRVILFFITFINLACGLPEPTFLQPPTVSYIRDPNSNEYDLLFRNGANSKNIFMGYEIYYKIYDPINATESLYSTEKDTIQNSSAAGKTVLANNGFNRLFFSTTPPSSTSFRHNTNMPSFSIESDLLNISFQIRILFGQNNTNETDSFYAYIFENNNYSFSKNPYLYRYVENIGSNVTETYKLFDVDDFDLNDDDMPATIKIDNYSKVNYLYVSFFIMSYGLDQVNLKDVYSEPEYLGTLKLEANITDISNNAF